MRETWVWSLGWEDPLEKEMATYSSTLAWEIPRMEECSRLQFMGSQRAQWDSPGGCQNLQARSGCRELVLRFWESLQKTLECYGKRSRQNPLSPFSLSSLFLERVCQWCGKFLHFKIPFSLVLGLLRDESSNSRLWNVKNPVLGCSRNLLYMIWNMAENFAVGFLLKACGGFPGGSVVKNPPASAGDTGSIPGLGRSHQLWSN